MVRIYEEILKCNIEKLDNYYNPVYTLSGGIDSSLIWSYLDNPECFCVQVDGNTDWEYAKKLYPKVKKIEFNNVDIEKILHEIQSNWSDFYCNMSDMYDYFVYKQYKNRLIIVGEEPRYDEYGNDITMICRKLFFHFRYDRVDSPYMYHNHIYDKSIIMKLAKKRLPDFIANRKKRNYSGPNPVWIKNHKDQIKYLNKKYNIEEENFEKMWKELNFKIWRNIHENNLLR